LYYDFLDVLQILNEDMVSLNKKTFSLNMRYVTYENVLQIKYFRPLN